MRKTDKSIIEVKEEVQLQGLGVTLEAGDKIRVMESKYRFMLKGKVSSRNHGWTDSTICGDASPGGMVTMYSNDFPQAQISVNGADLWKAVGQLATLD